MFLHYSIANITILLIYVDDIIIPRIDSYGIE